MTSRPEDAALSALEASLRALKLAHGARLTLRKRGNPFPLEVTRAVQPPAAYAMPDLLVRVVLADADLAAAAETAVIEVQMEHAPKRLLAAVRAQTAARWRQLASVGGAARVGDAVGLLGDWVASNFAVLVSQIPALLERVDMPGADDTTSRCFVFVAADDDDEPPAPPAEPAALPVLVPPDEPSAVAPALAAELGMASRRYKTLRWVAQPGGGCSLSVDVTPLDPQWRAAGLPSLLRVEGRAPGDFPAGVVVLEPQCAALHPRLAERVARGLAVEAGRLCGQRNALRALLAFAADHAGHLAIDDEGDTDESEAEEEDDEESASEDDEDAFRPSAGAVDGASDAGALAMSLSGLELTRIDCLEPATALLACRCLRCSAIFEATWRAEAQPAGTCAACSAPWRLAVRPRLAHAASPVVASLLADGCAVFEALRFDVVVGCGDCGASGALRGVAREQPTSRNCARCHVQLVLRFSAVAFTAAAGSAKPQQPRHAGPRSGPAAPAGGGVAAGARGGLTPGAPLPALGACRHYAHSHRWLRFPCCGRLFPCDVCHELAPALSDRCAIAPWCSKMVCGFCSREQPAAGIDGRCCACGRRVAGGAGVTAAAGSRPGSHHWEGGRGCRDRTRLSRVRAAAHAIACSADTACPAPAE